MSKKPTGDAVSVIGTQCVSKATHALAGSGRFRDAELLTSAVIRLTGIWMEIKDTQRYIQYL